jgi:serine/threonine-protein kinase
MPAFTPAAVVALLRASRLLRPEHLGELDALGRRLHQPRDLVRAVLRRGWLTPYQALELFQGRGPDLLVGNYVVLGRLGEGSTSHIFKARRQAGDGFVALKVVRPGPDAPPALAGCLVREAQAAASLCHPNILRAFEAGQVDRTHFLALEYVEGTDLARQVRGNGPLPVGRACDYIRQSALGLQHAHDRGLVHRDVKPSNLLLARDGTVKVLDLGISRRVGEPANDAAMGTPDYVAPEQVFDPGPADPRSDLYGLGCTLYHLLTGRPPFPGGTQEEKLLRHRREEPEPVGRLRPEVPPELAAAVRRMLDKDPAGRYRTPGEAAEVLAAFAEAGGCADNFVLVVGDEGLAGLDPDQVTVTLARPHEAR